MSSNLGYFSLGHLRPAGSPWLLRCVNNNRGYTIDYVFAVNNKTDNVTEGRSLRYVQVSFQSIHHKYRWHFDNSPYLGVIN